MKKFLQFVTKQTITVVLTVTIILAFGVYSTSNLPINLLPDIKMPMICIQVLYPGANAQSVEKDITKKLEDNLSSVSGVNDISSYSYDNLSAIVLSFEYGTDTKDKKSTINSKLSTIDLPDNTTVSVYDIDLNADALAVLSVTGTGGNQEENLINAYKASTQLSNRINAIDGVESVEIKGGSTSSYVISPYFGIDLLTPLIVQAFSYGGLDIPLGNITEDHLNVQIRNNTDIDCEDDIYDMPITLPPSMVSLMTSIKRTMVYYEDSTKEDLIELQDDLGEGVIKILGELDLYSSQDMIDFSTLKTYINIATSYTADDLKRFKSSRIYDDIYKAVTNDPLVEGDKRTPKTDSEIDQLVTQLQDTYPTFSAYLTADMLKVVRDGKLDIIIDFREDYIEDTAINPDYNSDEYYKFKDIDYYVLETQYVKVYKDKIWFDEANISNEEKLQIEYKIQFALKTSATGLADIGENKRKNEEAGELTPYVPTNTQCTLLFAGTELSSQHPIITSPTFMAFVRSPYYENNMQALINNRGMLGDVLTADDYYNVYKELNLTDVFEFKVSTQLFNFLIDTDLSQLTDSTFVVPLSEIANISKEDNYTSYVYFADGKLNIIQGVTIEVYKSNGANSSQVVNNLKKIYNEYLNENQSTIQITLLDDQSEFISDSISNVLISMVIGGFLAVLVIYLFIKKWRTSIIIAVTMPLSVLSALICFRLMGITLNMVSLGGLAVGIGMLVDNSIVVIESIEKHRDLGKTPYESAVDGTCEVAGALIGSTLTTVCVFIPIIFSKGLTGEIFVDLSWAVIFSLTFSLIIAVTVIPTFYGIFNKKGDKKPNKKFGIMDKVTDVYGKILPKLLGKKVLTVIVSIVVFGSSVALVFITGTEFLPSIDKGQIEIDMTYGAGIELEDIQQDVSGFADLILNGNGDLDKVDNIDYLSVSIGKNGILALSDTGIIKVQLTTNRHTDRVVEQIRSLYTAYKAGGSISRSTTVKEIDGVVASLMSGTDDLSVTIMGSDSDTLREIAEEIKNRLSEEENGFKDVKTSATQTVTQYTLRFDKTKMAELGIDYQTTVMTLRIGIASYTACTVNIDDESYDINVKFDKECINTKYDLENFIVGADSNDGVKAVKLKDILMPIVDDDDNPVLDQNGQPVKVLVEEVESCIRHSNGNEMISVSASLPGVDTGTASKKMEKIAQSVLDEYSNYSFEQSGITSYLNDAFSGLVIALLVSFFLLYSVMAVQFGSFKKPFIVMSSIPFSFTGGFFALVLTGMRLNVVSFVGIIMLMGVVVNNAIVMLEKIKQLHNDGMDHFEAVTKACKVRLRPILMTTLTTILALIPLAIGIGNGSELMQPLGIVVIGGLLLGTLVTLVIVPTVYCLMYGLSAKSNKA